MKKGLLGLVVIALMVVGCQNYDDQFDDLNKKIASLSSDVTSLSSIGASVAALDQKITSLQGSALTDSDLADILSEIRDLETAVESIDNSGIEAEVANLDAEVATILEKLGDLLAANAFYEGNLTITNLGQLANVQELMNTGADDPTVTVKGNVLITVTSANGLKDSIASVNLILSKIRAVQGTVTVTSDADASLPALTYATGDVDLNGTSGKAAITAAKLLTVDGNMSLTGLNGVVAFPALSSAGTIQITEVAGKATVTTLNLGSLTGAATVQTSAGNLVLAKATNVHLGGVLPAVVTLDKCVDFQHLAGGTQGDLALTIGGKAATFSLGSTKFNGTITVTTTGDISLANVTEIATTTLVSSKSANVVNLSAVTKIVGPVDINAKSTDVNLTALKTLNSTLNIHGDATIDLPALATTAVTTITAPLATSFVAPKLATTSVVISLKPSADLTVSILNLADTTTPVNDILDWARVKTFTVAAQTNDLDVSAAVIMATLNFTGKQVTPVAAGAQNNSLTITSANTKLKDLVISSGSYLGTLTVSASKIVNLTTAGAIINTYVHSNADLESFNFGHSHLQGDNASLVSIVNNDDTALTSIDLSSLSKVATVEVTGNAKLATLVAPSADVLATSLATITVTIHSNKLPGTYTPATAPTGTVTYSAPVITSAALSSFKTWIQSNIDVDIATPIGGATDALIATNRDRTHVAAGDVALATGSGVTGNAVVFNLQTDETDNTSTSAAEKVTLTSLMAADNNATAGATGAATDDDNDDEPALGLGVNTARELATVAD